MTAKAIGKAVADRINRAIPADRLPLMADRPHPFTLTIIPFKKYSSSYTPASINIFTDGSKNDDRGHVASAFVAYSDNVLIAEGAERLNADCSVFQAELNAILM